MFVVNNEQMRRTLIQALEIQFDMLNDTVFDDIPCWNAAEIRELNDMPDDMLNDELARRRDLSSRRLDELLRVHQMLIHLRSIDIPNE